jgi:acylglycerol lipase
MVPETVPAPTAPVPAGPSAATHLPLSPPWITPEGSWFDAVGGLQLYEARWRPAGDPRACLVVVHGLKDHGARYGELASALAARGIVTLATDLRGHGKSGGDRVWVDSFDDYLADLDLSMQRARDTYPDRPIFLFGHSMGGTIATLFAITRKPNLQGLIISAGSLKPAASLTLPKVLEAKERSVFAPHVLTFALDDSLFSRDPAVVAGMATDPMIEDGAAPARTAAELIAARERLQPREGEVRAPLLVLHGSDDKVCNPDGSKEFVRRAGSQDRTLIVYDGFYHDLLHEPDHSGVLADIVNWIDARVAPRIATAA